MRVRTTVVMKTIPVGCSTLADARAEAEATLLDLGLKRARVDEVLLVVSELITNACEHGGGGPVTLSIISGEAFVTAEVTNSAEKDAVAPPAEWRLPEPLAQSGRGLGIVASLVDHAEVEWRTGTVVVRGRFSRDDSRHASAAPKPH